MRVFQTLVWRLYRFEDSTCVSNHWNPPWQYNKHQTTVEELEKCLDESVELTYYFGIFDDRQKRPK